MSHFNFGKALRVCQAKEGVSSIELAQRLGITKQQVSHWRYRDDAKLSLVVKVCVEVADFLEEATDKGSK